MAYASLEPFGEERADLRAGIICSVMANLQSDPKKRKKPFTPVDFMPDFLEVSRPPADDLTQQIKRAFSQFPKKQGGRRGH